MKIKITVVLLCLIIISTNAKNCRPRPPIQRPCIIDGCFSQLCDEGPRHPLICPDIFVIGGINSCYSGATCARQNDGNCGWTMTPELEACLANPPPIGSPVQVDSNNLN